MLKPSQISGLHTGPSSFEDLGWRKEPSHRDKNFSTENHEQLTLMNEITKGVPQTVTTPVAFRSMRGSMDFADFLQSRPSPNNEAPFDQDFLKEDLRGLGQRGGAKIRWTKHPISQESPQPFKLDGLGRRARRDYSSKPVEGGMVAMRSSRSMKISADPRTRNQSHKDQREPWQLQKKALSEKFGLVAWLPRKRLSPDTLEGIRALHAQYPGKFTTPILADQFKVSPDAIRRILKSNWRPKDEEEERRRRRWEKRGENIWSQMVEMGIKPPKRWRDMGVGKSRERKTAQSKSSEPLLGSESVTSSLRAQSTTSVHSITANGHETVNPVLLADRIL